MKNKKYLCVLLLIGLIICIVPFLCGKLFGSNIDWINQHVVFANYFRNNFYETGNLFPNISWNLGLGQNIYNFSYYGFLNPIILISYILPFISMTNYIIASSVILYLLSIYLFYKWISNKFSLKLTILLTMIFMLSGPLLYHFHRQIMFVNYMPFLLLSLIEIDKNKKNSLLFITLFITLIIFSSYYYSIGSILCIIIYYIYTHFNDKIKYKIEIFIPIIISALLSGILIIPTLYTILSGRTEITSSISLADILLPKLSFDNVLYGSYTLGLSAIVIPSLISLYISKDKKNIYLAVVLSLLIIFPVFRYILNGGLYIRSKVLIPFLPLYILSIGILIKSLIGKKVDYYLLIKITLLSVLISVLTGYFNIVYYLDLVLAILIIYLISHNKKTFAFILLDIEFISMFVGYNLNEDYVTIKENNELIKQNQIINQAINKDNSFYRVSNIVDNINNINVISNKNYYSASMYSSTYNYDYYNFYHNILNSNNDTYNHLMLASTNNVIGDRLFSVKYILSKYPLNSGYTLLSKNNDYYLYRNNNALSLGYASNNIYSKDTINYEYPYILEAMLTGIIVDNGDNYIQHYINKETPDYSISLGDYISVGNVLDYLVMEVSKDSNLKVTFKERIEDKVVFISISGLEENKCNTELSMTINNITNRLTCKEWNYPNNNNTFNFVINKHYIDNLDIKVSKGTYRIGNVSIYTMDNSILNNHFDLMNNIVVSDNMITGDINVTSDGYMTLSIPYDEGYTVIVDNNKIQYEKVNGGFLGYRINKGYHKIKIIYNAPYLNIGIISSLFGILLFILSIGVRITKHED